MIKWIKQIKHIYLLFVCFIKYFIFSENEHSKYQYVIEFCLNLKVEMLVRQNQAKLVFLVIICCFCCSFLTIFYILSNHGNLGCDCSDKDKSVNYLKQEWETKSASSEDGDHKLCLIVPFRDRFQELMEFAPYMSKFLSEQKVAHEIYVLHQTDKFR